MTYSEAEESMIQRFLANPPIINGTPLDLTYIKTPNSKFKKPKDSTWARLSVVNGESQNVEPGEFGRTRQDCIFVIDMFYSRGTGRKEKQLVEQQIISLYKKKYFDHIRSKTVRPLDIGIDENWFHHQTQVFYQFDDC